MKCLVVSVLVIVATVVFTVNCRGDDVPGQHEEGSNAERVVVVKEAPDTELDVPEQPEGRSLTNNDHQLVITDITLLQHKAVFPKVSRNKNEHSDHDFESDVKLHPNEYDMDDIRASSSVTFHATKGKEHPSETVEVFHTSAKFISEEKGKKPRKCKTKKSCKKLDGKCTSKKGCNGIIQKVKKGCSKKCVCCVEGEKGGCAGVIVGHQCLSFSSEELNWNEAQQACISQGGRLAKPGNLNELLDYVIQHYGEGTLQLWIGGSDIINEGTWLWLDGSPMSNFPWGRDQPDNYGGNEHCLEVNYAGGYNDEPCTVKSRYICELVSGPCVCGTVNRIEKIVGGTVTEVNEYPWQVALVSQGSSNVYCGGSLINDRWVLTAAHCTTRGVDQVILGNHINSQINSGEMRVNIRSVVDHPNYNDENQDNDFSLLELATPLNLEDVAPHIRPVCLPSTINPSQYDNVLAIVTGWGTTSSGGDGSDVLLEVAVRTMNNVQCNQQYDEFDDAILSSMICASLPGKDACQGDSGGPLVTEVGGYYNLIGVVSWGLGCADSQYPGVYARVTDALNWITSTTSSGRTCAPPN